MGILGKAGLLEVIVKRIDPAHSLKRPYMWTNGQTQSGPAFQDLMLGWIQLESDNNTSYSIQIPAVSLGG